MKHYEIETESLEAHVSICQERYQALADRLNSMDNRIEKIEILMMDIHQDIEELKQHNNNQWDRAKDVIIGVLLATTGFLLSQQIF